MKRILQIGLILILQQNVFARMNKPTCAVLTFEARLGVTAAETQMLSERFATEFDKFGRYTIVARSQMIRILEEQKFQAAASCAAAECAVEAGRLLGVRFMIYGSVGRMGQVYSINSFIIDIETGAQLRSATTDIRGNIENLLTEGMGLNARLLMGEEQETATFIDVIVAPASASLTINGNACKPGLNRVKPETNHVVIAQANGYKQYYDVHFVKLGQTKPIEINLVPLSHSYAEKNTEHRVDGVVFRLRGSLGILQGESGEYVYDGEHTLSELMWDLSGLTMAGLVLSSRFGERFSVNAGFWTALNKGNGEMTDYDWFIEGLDWTHYSRSEVEVEKAQIFDLNAAFTLVESDFFSLSALAGYKQDFWQWTDSAQEFIYSVYGFRDTRGDFGGESMIDYEQKFRIPYIGVNAGGIIGDVIIWNTYLHYSPLVKADDKDHHIARGLHFEETFKNIDYVAFGAAAGIRLTERLQIAGEMHAQSIPESRGDMYIVEYDETFTDSAGISHDSVMLSVTATWRF
jgi:outer membrane protease/TolB-like protein